MKVNKKITESAVEGAIKTHSCTQLAALQRAILAWYDAHARRLPWRLGPGSASRPDPYRVWLSEVILQQTTAAAAAPRFERFLQRFPTLAALAAAPQEAVLQEWAGLGYYARARNLHAAAQVMASNGPPSDEAGWRALPGVGAYTAAAVAAIAYQQVAAPVDANIERVLVRLLAIPGDRTRQKAAVRRLAPDYVPAARPGDWAQALMDLGASVCTPRGPGCAVCPAETFCRARALNPEDFPQPIRKSVKPSRRGSAFWLETDGHVWLVRRPQRGLLAGMAALPTGPWLAPPGPDPLAHAPATADWKACGYVDHTFTHFALRLQVFRASANAPPIGEGWWAPVRRLDAAGLPTLFAKAAALASGVEA